MEGFPISSAKGLVIIIVRSLSVCLSACSFTSYELVYLKVNKCLVVLLFMVVVLYRLKVLLLNDDASCHSVLFQDIAFSAVCRWCQ